MKKEISFELFCTVLGRGLKQAVIALGGLFGIKDGNSLMRFAKRVFMVSISIIAAGIAIGLCIEAYDIIDREISHYHAKKNHHWNTKELSEDYCYYYDYINPGYIKNTKTGKKVIDDILWLYEPDGDDPLVTYKINGNKRGYFNFNTGEEPVTPSDELEKAWVFSEGLAAVKKNGKILFINPKGEQAFESTFRFDTNLNGLFFHGGYCIAKDEESNVGMIDKTGNWVLEPEYNNIENIENRFWIVTDHFDNEGIINDSIDWIMPTEYENIKFSQDGGFYASKDGIRKKYDLTGSVIDDFVITNVRTLYYDSEENGESVSKVANCLVYTVDYYREGLLSADGRPLTKAIYSGIRAISPNRFIAGIEDDEHIILDDKGNIVQ